MNVVAETRDVDVNDVVERRGAIRLFPDIARQAFARDDLTGMADKIFEQFEFPCREIQWRSIELCAASQEVETKPAATEADDRCDAAPRASARTRASSSAKANGLIR